MLPPPSPQGLGSARRGRQLSRDLAPLAQAGILSGDEKYWAQVRFAHRLLAGSARTEMALREKVRSNFSIFEPLLGDAVGAQEADRLSAIEMLRILECLVAEEDALRLAARAQVSLAAAAPSAATSSSAASSSAAYPGWVPSPTPGAESFFRTPLRTKPSQRALPDFTPPSTIREASCECSEREESTKGTKNTKPTKDTKAPSSSGSGGADRFAAIRSRVAARAAARSVGAAAVA